ncbi:FAD binding domain-containing protein [Luteimonas abyssi]|uniref:FAD binding domain-containing protein n=1 Tax=Luteimonas abyssi TaxID=1247514 RepID=UPI000737D2B4|nr:xanthine dehydrogenase family protein subunit M [Luteimonas abyssi]
MTPFAYRRATDAAAAVMDAAAPGARFLGGGTNLVDLLRQRVARADALVDVSMLPASIEVTPEGGLSIGAAVRNSTLAAHPHVRAHFPVLSRAVLAGASAQIRNMATVGGNILQRTRCAYFYDVDGARCNKRAPGSGCDARGGFTRYHAILGGSAHCVATHPSDMCVALVALDARVRVLGPRGERTMPLVELHRLPGDRPHLETHLAPDELIVSVEVPPLPAATRSAYRKVRDRASYAFALISVAAVLEVREGTIDTVRIAFGGVAPKPWRATRAEAALVAQRPTEALFREAADAELAAADPLSGNAFKPDLLRRTLAAVLRGLLERAA